MSKPLFPSCYSCEDCLYSESVNSEYTGICRRHPPTKINYNYITEFPTVNLKRDWCGEMELHSAVLAELEEANNTKTTNAETTTDKE